MRRSWVRRSCFLIFAASGFSGLIYEHVWTHYLKLVLGSAAYAQTLVLAIFLGGMAGGAAWSSRTSRRWRDPLVGYVAAEAAIGVLAFAFHPTFRATFGLTFDRILPALGSPVLSSAVLWTLGALLILPQSILLGATFPLMSAGVLRRFPGEPGASIAILYFSNSLGAALGVLASGFYLVGRLGLAGTIATAGAINLMVAAAMAVVARSEPSSAAGDEEVPRLAGVARPADPWLRLLLAAAAVTGLASFVYEIGWIRMLTLVLGSTTHSFELMLSAFILGLAFGGLWIRGRIERLREPVRFLGFMQLAMGLLALATLPIYGETFDLMKTVLATLGRTPRDYVLFHLSSHGIALLVMFPATFCAGTTLPLITYALIRKGHGEKSIGAVYAANTMGAIAAVFLAVHLGLPLLGLKGTITIGAALDMSLGIVLLAKCSSRGARRAVLAAAATAAIAILAVVALVRLDAVKMASGVYRLGLLFPPETTILFHEDGKTASVDLVRDKFGTTSIRTNGKPDAGIALDPSDPRTPDELTMTLLGALGPVFRPTARTAANIGMGSGLTTHTLLATSLTRVDTVEIEPAMVEAARGFRPRVERAFTDPRSRIHVEDAKSFFATRSASYDIIVSEPSNPWVSGVAGLFTKEFYELLSRRLNDGGVLVQWVQLYEIDLPALASIFRALSPHFADYRIYAAGSVDAIVVARKGGPVGAPDPSVVSIPRLAADLALLRIRSVEDIEARRIGSKKTLEPLFASQSVPANSDYEPYLDLRAGMTRFLGSGAGDLIRLAEAPLPVLEMLGDDGPLVFPGRVASTPWLERGRLVRAARGLAEFLTSGNAAALEGRVPEEAAQRALRLRPRFTECSAPGGTEALLVELVRTGLAMGVHVSREEAAAFWDFVEAQPCVSSLSERDRVWISLFRAAGARDAKRMAAAATSILESRSAIDGEAGEYLLCAAMLGRVAEGRAVEAEEFWREHSPRILRGAQPSLLLRLVLEHARQTSGAPRPAEEQGKREKRGQPPMMLRGVTLNSWEHPVGNACRSTGVHFPREPGARGRSSRIRVPVVHDAQGRHGWRNGDSPRFVDPASWRGRRHLAYTPALAAPSESAVSRRSP